MERPEKSAPNILQQQAETCTNFDKFFAYNVTSVQVTER